MDWIIRMINIYICYYTLMYGVKLFKKDKNKLAGSLVFMLAISLLILPLLIRFGLIGSE